MSSTRTIFIAIAAAALLAGSAPLSHADQASTTQQNALETLKESVNTLVGVKDESGTTDVAFRIEAFKKVIDFSVTEAQSLKLKLLAATDSETSTSTLAWKDAAIARINDALGFYGTESTYLGDHAVMTLDEVKALADQFKAWRDTTYIPLSNEVTDFLLVRQEDKALGITEARAQKIRNDLTRLQAAFGAKKVQSLYDLLAKAASSTKTGKDLNAAADALFKATYIDPLLSTSTVAAATSSDIVATSSLPAALANGDGGTDASSTNATSTAAKNATSTPESAVAIPPPSSIRGLVERSLANVKETYRTFIEMSGLVRKLLE